MEILSILRFLFLLSVLIFVHEGGHFLIARLFGVAVEEFGFGIPPRIWGKKIALGSPGGAAGIAEGDYILSFNGERVETAEELLTLTKDSLEKTATLGFERDSEAVSVSIVPRADPPKGEGPLGVGITTAIK